MKTLLLFSTCVLGWGVAVFLMGYVSRTLNLGTILVCNLVGYAAGIAILARGVHMAWTWNHLLAALLSVCMVVANAAYYRLSHGGEQATILAPLTSLYVVVTVVLSLLLIQGETMTPRRLAGIALAVVAAVLLTWER